MEILKVEKGKRMAEIAKQPFLNYNEYMACMFATVNDSMDVVVSVFDRTRAWTLPVVDDEGRFVGFIRKSAVLSAYRQLLSDFSVD